MFPLVLVELGLGAFIFILAVGTGQWEVGVPQLAILVFVSIVIDSFYLYSNWKNPMM